MTEDADIEVEADDHDGELPDNHDMTDTQLRDLMPVMGVNWAEAFLVRKLVYYWVGRYLKAGKKAGLDRDDLAQLAWCAAIKGCNLPDRIGISTIVSKFIKNKLHEQTRYDLKEVELEPEHNSEIPTPKHNLDEKQALLAAMKKLTKDERYLIKSYYWHGIQFPDIQRRMHWSKAHLYRTLKAAKAKLRDLIEPIAIN